MSTSSAVTPLLKYAHMTVNGKIAVYKVLNMDFFLTQML